MGGCSFDISVNNYRRRVGAVVLLRAGMPSTTTTGAVSEGVVGVGSEAGSLSCFDHRDSTTFNDP
jgi:hypothetical protein